MYTPDTCPYIITHVTPHSYLRVALAHTFYGPMTVDRMMAAADIDSLSDYKLARTWLLTNYGLDITRTGASVAWSEAELDDLIALNEGE